MESINIGSSIKVDVLPVGFSAKDVVEKYQKEGKVSTCTCNQYSWLWMRIFSCRPSWKILPLVWVWYLRNLEALLALFPFESVGYRYITSVFPFQHRCVNSVLVYLFSSRSPTTVWIWVLLFRSTSSGRHISPVLLHSTVSDALWFCSVFRVFVELHVLCLIVQLCMETFFCTAVLYAQA